MYEFEKRKKKSLPIFEQTKFCEKKREKQNKQTDGYSTTSLSSSFFVFVLVFLSFIIYSVGFHRKYMSSSASVIVCSLVRARRGFTCS